MLTEEDELPVVSKKKIDKGQSSGDASTSPDKGEIKKSEKNDGEDPKPRIVLTFRSDKKNCNMKIVPNDEKHEEISPRRSTRRSKWEWSEEAETSISPKKDKNSSQSVSETDETSDSSQTTTKRLTRRRSKDSLDNVLPNAIARKEKSMNEAAPGPTQRLSRRIKPTAKILANEELRIGLESQNNARLGIQNEKPEEGVRTRRTRSMQPEGGSTEVSKRETRINKVTDEIEVADDSPEEPNANNVMKLKHLCELGLKAINAETLEDEPEEMEEDEEAELEDDDDDDLEEEEEEEDEEDDDEIDDDSEVISKLLEADEDSSVEFNCAVESSQSRRPRRSTRLHSSFGVHYNDSPIPVDDEQKETLRRSRRSARFDESQPDADLVNLCDGEYRPPRKRNRERHEEVTAEEEKDEGNNRERRSRRLKEDKRSKWLPETFDVKAESADENSEPAGGEEGSEAACPEDESAVVATCYCETPSNVHAAPEDVPEPVFCQAIELVDGVRVGCSHQARRADDGALDALLRAGPRAPFVLLCALHAAQLHRHMCCPTCGLFCTQGIFYQCSEGHLFHLECGLPYNDVKQKPGCPHCGVRSYRWQPRNKLCSRVQLAMRCSNKRIFLPDQREQCTPAYLGFTRLEESQIDLSPVIPEDLLPSPPIDLKRLCQESVRADNDDLLTSTPAQRLCDAILAGETLEMLLPKIVSRACVNTALTSLSGGTSVHAASSRARADALYALQYAGADLDAPDNALRTPLILALQTLFDKPDKKSPTKNRNINEKESKDEESKEEELNGDKDEKEEVDDDSLIIKRDESVKDEDLIKVIRYLVAAGCDVNIQGAEGMTALHMAAQHGSAAVCQILLDANAEPDARDLGGWTPLVWAAENAHDHVVRLLLSRGAQADTVDAEGNSALHWCALAGHAPTTSLLLAAAPAARDRPNAHRDTPLHVAARQGHYACVVILLARGARTDIENSAGSLPVEVCEGPSQSAISLNMQMKLLVEGAAVRHELISSDISNGTEMFPVACVNEVDDAPLAPFTYVADHVMPEPLLIDHTIQSMQGCSCADGDCAAAGCACGVLSVRRWTTAQGRLPPHFPHHDPPMLFECNATCSCNKQKCGNMVISRLKSRGSLFVRATVFRTRAAGWGLRAEAHARRGAPVALYCGELLPLPAADARPNDQYLFALDVKPDLLQQCNDKTLLCVDACLWGSAARFINHSCRPNLAPVRVFSSTRDLRLPNVTLFAIKDIRPGDELTFDYGDKFWSVKSKWMKCECGTPECRYPVKSTDSDN